VARFLVLTIALLAVLAPAASASETIATEQGRIHADAHGKRIAWSSFDPQARVWRLNTRQKGKVVRTAARPLTHPFRLDVGPGPDGKPVAVYPRCKGDSCNLFLYDFAARKERRLKGVSTKEASESLPTIWRNRIAFSRRIDGVSTMYVARLNGKRMQVVPGGTRTGPSGPIALELNRKRVAFVWSRQGAGGFTQTELWVVRDGMMRLLDATASSAQATTTFVTPELRGKWAYYGRPLSGRPTGNEVRRAHLVKERRVQVTRAPFKGMVASVWMGDRFLFSRALPPQSEDPEGECRAPGSDPSASVCRLVVGDPVERWKPLGGRTG
jgi:hypothetical protein